MEIKNALIEKTRLTTEDHGVLTAWLTLDYGDSHQDFGGYALYLPKTFKHHSPGNIAGHFIFRVLQVAGVTEWKNLLGRAIRVQIENGLICAIGHITKDDWFCPKDDFQEIKKQKEK